MCGKNLLCVSVVDADADDVVVTPMERPSRAMDG